MQTVLSSKGQVVLPAEARRALKLGQGDRMSVEVKDGGVFLRPVRQGRRYRVRIHPISGLPVMVPLKPPPRKVTAAEVARLAAELG